MLVYCRVFKSKIAGRINNLEVENQATGEEKWAGLIQINWSAGCPGSKLTVSAVDQSVDWSTDW